MEDLNFSDIGTQLWDILFLVGYALLALIVGFWVVGRVTKIIEKILESKDVDVSLQKFLTRLVNIGLKVLVLISVAGLVGIPTTSFVAVIGAAGLAVGLALQGSLANFAGGVLILFLKPFKVGDFIEGAGHTGTVEEISIFYTHLKTPKNQAIVIPNAQLSNNSIVNYSTKPIRRLDIVFGIDYSDDIDLAKDVLKNIISSDSRVLDDPPFLIAVDTLGDNAVNIVTKSWCKNEDYWDLNYEFMEKVKKEFDANGISFPFPQQDIHIIKD
ncbi:MAG: mechanosensitive ion channel [Candidatus Kapaibacterium sp.]|nr:mechanosensitive ion channel [Ignavibacteriota bacterium]MCB9220642.1 mechanosensitive ion channel [Ignavibacteria bacterium]